jgi:hypothetical protein
MTDGSVWGSSGSSIFPIDSKATKFMPNIRRALANVRANLGPARVAIVGDSTVFGVGANNNAAVNSRLWGLQYFTAKILTAKGLPAHDNSWFGVGSTTDITQKHSADPRVTFGATSPTAGLLTTSIVGIMPLITAAIAGPAGLTDHFAQFIPGTISDTVDLYYSLGNAPNAKLSYGTSATPTASTELSYSSVSSVTTGIAPGGNEIKRFTFLPTRGANNYWAYNKTGAGANFYVMGMDLHDSQNYAVSIWNLGRGGSKMNDYLHNTPGYGGTDGFDNLSSMSPDLVIFQVPLLNDLIAGTPIASVAADLQTYISNLKSTGLIDVTISVDIPRNAASTPLATQLLYVEAIKTVAYVNGLVFLNSYDRWGSYETATALGFMSGDGLHPRDIGYADKASDYANFILSL